jgi:hypothetical protein
MSKKSNDNEQNYSNSSFMKIVKHWMIISLLIFDALSNSKHQDEKMLNIYCFFFQFFVIFIDIYEILFYESVQNKHL